MAIVGLKMIRLALVDKEQKLITGVEQGLSESGIYEVDEKDFGTKTANITNLEGTGTKVPGNNQVMDEYYGPASPSVALDMNNLAFVIAQKVLGNKADGKGGYVYSGEKPRVAMSIETQTLDRKNSIFFGFGNGNMTAASQNIGTDTDTTQTREDDNITYNALSTKAFGGQAIKRYFTGDEGFDEKTMMSEVFGGYSGDVSSTGQTDNTSAGSSTVAVSSVTLDKNDATVKVGATVKLAATVNPTTATDKSGKWTVEDDTVATVTDDGTITGVKAGTTSVTYTSTDGAKTAQATLTVTAA